MKGALEHLDGLSELYIGKSPYCGECVPAELKQTEIPVYIEIRGKVEILQAGACQHLDQLTRQYTKHPCYYGYIFPVEQRVKETRVICRLHAEKITLDAIQIHPIRIGRTLLGIPTEKLPA